MIHSETPEDLSQSLYNSKIPGKNSAHKITSSSVHMEESEAQSLVPAMSRYDRALKVFQTVAQMPTNQNEVAKWHSDLVKQVNALVEHSEF